MLGKAFDLQDSMICESRVSGTSPVHKRLVHAEHDDWIFILTRLVLHCGLFLRAELEIVS